MDSWTHPSFCVSAPGVCAGFPEECVEQHGLSDGHVGAKVVVLSDVGNAVLEALGTDGDAVDQDVAMQFHLPGVVGVGKDVTEGSAFAFC